MKGLIAIGLSLMMLVGFTAHGDKKSCYDPIKDFTYTTPWDCLPGDRIVEVWCVNKGWAKPNKVDKSTCATMKGTAFFTESAAISEHKRINSSTATVGNTSSSSNQIWCTTKTIAPFKTSKASCKGKGGYSYQDRAKAQENHDYLKEGTTFRSTQSRNTSSGNTQSRNTSSHNPQNSLSTTLKSLDLKTSHRWIIVGCGVAAVLIFFIGRASARAKTVNKQEDDDEIKFTHWEKRGWVYMLLGFIAVLYGSHGLDFSKWWEDLIGPSAVMFGGAGMLLSGGAFLFVFVPEENRYKYEGIQIICVVGFLVSLVVFMIGRDNTYI